MTAAPAFRRSTLAQADVLLLLARTLAGAGLAPPSEEEVDALAAVSGLDRCGDAGGTLRELCALGRRHPEDRAEHVRLFEGAAPCPPNETAFVRRDKGAVLGDICGFYRAFGFELADGSGEKADHVATELEFTAFLLVMLACADRVPGDEARVVTHEALGSFVHDHLGEWVPAFCDRLEQASGHSGLRAAAAVLRNTLELVIDAHALPRPVPGAYPGVPADAGTPYECGMDATTPGCGSPRSS